MTATLQQSRPGRSRTSLCHDYLLDVGDRLGPFGACGLFKIDPFDPAPIRIIRPALLFRISLPFGPMRPGVHCSSFQAVELESAPE